LHNIEIYLVGRKRIRTLPKMNCALVKLRRKGEGGW